MEEEEKHGESGVRMLVMKGWMEDKQTKKVEREVEEWRDWRGKYRVDSSCGIIDAALAVVEARGSLSQGGNQNSTQRQREDQEPSRGAALTLNPPLLRAKTRRGEESGGGRARRLGG